MHQIKSAVQKKHTACTEVNIRYGQSTRISRIMCMQSTWLAFKVAVLVMLCTAVAAQLVFSCLEWRVVAPRSPRPLRVASKLQPIAGIHSRKPSLASFRNTGNTTGSNSPPPSCARLSWQQNQTSNASRGVLCTLTLADLFRNSVLNTSLTVVTTTFQHLDQFPWHRCVVFGRFATVTAVDIAQFADNSKNVTFTPPGYVVLMERANTTPQIQSLIGSADLRGAPSILLIADELCNEDYTQWSSVRAVLRHYVCNRDTVSAYVPNGFRELAFGELPAFRGQISPNATCAGSVSIVAASRRTHFFNYQGSVRRGRAKMAASVKSQYAVSTLSDACYYFSSSPISGPSFQAAVFNSVFTLCPCGNNIETHRLWEALLAGSIPVQEDCSTDAGNKTNLSERQFIQYLEQHLPHVIVIKEWDSLSSVLAAYSNDGAAMDAKQKSLYISYMRLMVQIGTQSADLIMAGDPRLDFRGGLS